MILNKKLIIIILFLFLSACKLDNSLCYSENDYGNSGDYDTVIVGAGNSMCNYDLTKEITNLSQSSTVRTCLNEKKITDFTGNNNVGENVKKISEASRNKLCADLYTYIKNGIFDGIVFIIESEQTLNNFNNNNKDILDNLNDPKYMEKQNEQEKLIQTVQNDKFAIINSIFEECVNVCQEQCNTNNSAPQVWTSAKLKGDDYLGISLKENTVLNITTSGSVVLDSDNSETTAIFNKYGIEDINRRFYLKNGDLTTINIKLNKNFINTNETGTSDEMKKRNFKNRTYLSLKEYNPSLSYGNNNDIEAQEPRYNAVKCTYDESNKYSVKCEFDYTGINSIGDNIDFKSIVEKYYNEKYVNQQIRVFNKNDYYAYASDAFNQIGYENGEITINGAKISEIDNNNNSEDDENKVKVQQNINGLNQVLNSFGGSDGYIWNNGQKEFRFTNKGPFKLAIKYLGTDNLSECTYSFSYKDYRPGDSSGNKINNNYIAVYSGKSWKTVKNTIKNTETNTIVNGNEEVVFNRFATPNNNGSEMAVTIKVESGGEICSKGIGIKVINLKDYPIYETGFLMLSIPSTNGTGNIKYKLLNQDMITMTAGKSITAADKIKEFFENNSNLTYEELSISNSSDAGNLSIGSISDLVNNNKVIYVRKGQILRFDYSNWMTFNESTGKIELKEVNNGKSSYFGVGLNVFIKQNPLYMCYGTATEAVSLENKCYNEGGTFESFIGANDTETGECFIQVNECYLKGNGADGIIKKFNSVDATKSNNGNCIRTLSESEIETLNDMEFTLSSFVAQSLIPMYNRDKIKIASGDENLYKECYNDVIGDVYGQVHKCFSKLNGYKVYKGVVESDEEAVESSREVVSDNLGLLKNLKAEIKFNIIDQKLDDSTTITHEETKKILITSENGEVNQNFKNIKDCTNNSEVNIFDNGENGVGFKVRCDSSIKQSIYEALLNGIKSVFYMTETTITDENGTNTTFYTDHFYYYKDVCEGSKTSSGNCKEEGVAQCYDFSNYKGSVEKAITRIKGNLSNSNLSETDISISGFLTATDETLGAVKLNEFNGKNGLIKNLIDSKNTTSSDDTNNYYFLNYSDNIYSDSMANFAVYIINNFTETGIDYETNFKNFIKNSGNSNNNDIIILKSESEHSYRNGDRLSVIIGKAKNNAGSNLYYYSELDAENKETGNIYYTETEGGSASSGVKNDYFPIVVYDKETNNISKDSPFKFNEKGILVNATKTTEKGAYFEGLDAITINGNNFGKIQEYISKDGTEKNLYFKVIDIDSKVENNSGSYTLTVNTYNASESKILSYFRDFFNKVLSFIDGGYLKIEVDSNGNKIPCNEETNSKYCIIYSETNVMNNGNSCLSTANGNENCYSNCSKNENEGESCEYKYFYNGKGFIKNTFEMFINNHLYQFIAKIALVLAITTYGFSYFFGLSNFTQGEIVTRIIRFCFIYFIISPSGWKFFDGFIIKFFKDGVDSLLFLVASAFDSNIMSDLNTALNTGDFSDKSALFSTTFSNFELIFSEQIFNKMIGLAFSGWFGFIYLYLVLSAVVNYITASLSAIVLYLSAQVYMSLVFCFFPLVVLFMFFERTKKTFDNWINLLIGFAGQQLFLITTLSFFNLLVLTYIKSTFSYRVCLLPIFNLSIGGLPLALITFWKIPGVSFSDPIEKVNEAMPSFYSIIGFYVVTVLMTKFITGMVEVGKTIFGGIGIEGGMAEKINQGINTVGAKAKAAMKNTGKQFGTGMANRFLGGKAIENYKNSQQKERTARRNARANYFKDFKKEVDGKLDKYAKSDEFKKDLTDKLANNDEYKRLSEISKSSGVGIAEQREAQKKMKEIEQNTSKELLKGKENEISGDVAKERYEKQYKNIIGEDKMNELVNDPKKLEGAIINTGHGIKEWFPEKSEDKKDGENNNDEKEIERKENNDKTDPESSDDNSSESKEEDDDSGAKKTGDNPPEPAQEYDSVTKEKGNDFWC